MSECRCGKEDCPDPQNCVCGDECACDVSFHDRRLAEKRKDPEFEIAYIDALGKLR